MNLAPVVDLRPAAPAGDPRDDDRPPSNIEAEQAVLGILLFDNDVLDRLPERLAPEHFTERFHADLFALCVEKIRKGQLADPITVMERFRSDPAFEDYGGIRYLADLIDRAPPARVAPDYAAEVIDQADRRELIRIAGQIISTARGDATVKTVDLVEAAERDIHALLGGSAGVSFTYSQGAVDAVLGRLDSDARIDGGVAWGLAPLDRQLGPMMEGDLIVLGGRTAMGKSALAAELALNIARQGKACIEINGEMTVEQMTRRHLTSIAFTEYGKGAPAYSDIRKRTVSSEQRQMLTRAGEALAELPLSMLKRTGLSFSTLRSLVRREQSKREREGLQIGAVIVDHVGLIRCDTKGRSRYEDQTEISNGLKELADELKIPIIGLAQLNRQTEMRDNKRPILADLRDSGAWEQDADVVIGVYRDAYYAQREPEPKDDGKPANQAKWAEWDARRRSKTIEAIILKAREGECGPADLWGDMATNAIRSREPENSGTFL